MKRIFALLLTLAMMLSLAGTAFAEPITDFVTYQTTANEMETFNILYSQYAKELDVLTNCIDGLLSNDNYGNLVPGLAETWETLDGGLTWTFNLRKGVKWVDYQANEKAEVVAEDFLWGLEWVLNEKKNLAANMSMPSEMLVGAQEYFDYTKELPEAD
ncbi:MAG TPA: ABC transporter substrate-binding protein, partial [Clostridia bacterium]|nr:ABC transporter substrate-binding protein [Clostridia bacterium]